MGVAAAPPDYKFGPCQERGCNAPAIFAWEKRVCLQHKPANVVFAPFCGQQEKFFQARQRWVLYGGAGGGGKTECGKNKFGQQLAIEAHRFQEARKQGRKFQSVAWGGYFRRVAPNFKQAVQRSRAAFEAMDPAAYYHENDRAWYFPSCGNAVFSFCTMEHIQDKYKFKSHEFTYIYVDEGSEFEEEQIDYLDTRLRTTDPFLEPLLQLCIGSNPDGPGMLWLRDRFIEPAPPETIVRVETKLRDGRIISHDQIYIPAKLDDNPLLMASGTYEASLMNKRPEVREAILSGNWYYGMSGTFLQNVWDSRLHVVENHDVPEGAKIFRAADWGIGHASSIGWFYEDRDGGLTCFAHLRTVGLTVDKVCQKMKKIEEEFGLWDEDADCSGLNFQRNPLDTACFGKGQGLMGARTIAKDFAACGFRWVPAKKGPGSRLHGASQILLRLSTMIPAAFDGATDPTERERPMLRFMQRCASPIKRLPTLRTDPDNPDDVDKDAGDDDDWDMCQYTCLQVPMDMPQKRDDDWDDDDVPVPARAKRNVGLGEGPWTRR